MASAALKGTRKTYSFEERRILLSLINRHEVVEDRRPDPVSVCKRKSAWSLIAEEYNSLVGPRAARSAVQLRRCWENMKACKRNREEKKSRVKAICQSRDESRGRNQCWGEGVTCGRATSEAPTSTGTVGLPPNVVFEPADSEPFTLQSVCTAGLQKPNCSRKDADSCRDLCFSGTFSHTMVDGNKCDAIGPVRDSTGDCRESAVKKNTESPVADQSAESAVERNRATYEMGAALRVLTSPSVALQQHNRKRKSAQREEELHMLALSEARMKVDIAAMLKEEARIKLEEAHYRKEEARLRMLLCTYKLDRVKED